MLLAFDFSELSVAHHVAYRVRDVVFVVPLSHFFDQLESVDLVTDADPLADDFLDSLDFLGHVLSHSVAELLAFDGFEG